jgi:Coenzyme PQQ synthesis protein D (PqqD)
METMTSYRIRSDQLSWRAVADEVVILDFETAAYWTLNDTGAALWERLASGPATVEQLVDQLIGEFDVTREVARLDLEAFLTTCLERNMIEIQAEDPSKGAGTTQSRR